MKKILLLSLALTLTLPAFSQTPVENDREVFGPLLQPAPSILHHVPQPPRPGLDSIRRWNEIALNAGGVDHTPVAPGEVRVFGEQVGPCRTARALAIVHIAMFDVLNAVYGKYESYTGVAAPGGLVAMQAAISQAAHDTLVELYPSQAATFDQRLAEDLAAVKPRQPKMNGILLGQSVAAAILDLRDNDGSQHAEPLLGVDWFTSNLPGHWRQDPISLVPIALGPYWKNVHPFVIPSAAHFRVPAPPALMSPKYTQAFREVKRLGGDGAGTPTERNADQTVIGIFWGYDGTPQLSTPPRLYNQVVVQIADQRGTSDLELARLLALVNVAMADAGIAIWESKYVYDIWRPVTGIREADPGTGPTGRGDGNPHTVGDPLFTPLGAPASNLTGPNFTPPFPAYPSGHAGFGGAVFEILRRFYHTDSARFTIVSDEYNGQTRDNQGNVRPYLPRSYSSFSQAEEENGQSRIYLGIHWAFDKTEGMSQGRRVGTYVYRNVFTPR